VEADLINGNSRWEWEPIGASLASVGGVKGAGGPGTQSSGHAGMLFVQMWNY